MSKNEIALSDKSSRNLAAVTDQLQDIQVETQLVNRSFERMQTAILGTNNSITRSTAIMYARMADANDAYREKTGKKFKKWADSLNNKAFHISIKQDVIKEKRSREQSNKENNEEKPEDKGNKKPKSKTGAIID